MGEGLVITLVNCTLNLWEADSDGNADGPALFMGARMERLQMSARTAEVNSTPSGAAQEEFELLGQEYFLRLGRIWVVDGKTRKTYRLERKKYVMTIYGEDERTGVYIRRTYYGVTAVSNDEDSNGISYFNQNQLFRARYYIETDGQVQPGEASPTGTETGSGPQGSGSSPEEPINFFHAGPVVADDYFLGSFQYPVAKKVVSARVLARAPQVSPTVLTLIIEGVETVVTLTLPVGLVNAETGAFGAFDFTVPANRSMRWKVISGPANAEDCAWQASISMNIKDVDEGYAAASIPLTGLEEEVQVDTIADLRLLPVPSSPVTARRFVRIINAVLPEAREVYWDGSSLEADNGETVFKPSVLSDSDPGRYKAW